MAGFKNRDLEAFFTQTNEEPFRELPRFEADVLNLTSLVSYELRNALRITLNLSFLDYATRRSVLGRDAASGAPVAVTGQRSQQAIPVVGYVEYRWADGHNGDGTRWHRALVAFCADRG